MRGRLMVLRIMTLLVLVVLVSRLAELQLVEGQRFRSRAASNTIRQEYVDPIRGEIYASDGTTLLAKTTPIFNVAVRADILPDDDEQRHAVYSRLAELLALTDTLTLSPTSAISDDWMLEEDLIAMFGPLPITATQEISLTLTVPITGQLEALELSQYYPEYLTYNSSVAQLLTAAQLPPYLPAIIKSDVPRELALVVRENQSLLPGVLVLRGYQRTYPLSAEVPSLSHLLGFVRRIGEGELAERNPTSGIGALDLYLPSDMIGKDGVELTYEDALRGTLGVRQLEVDVNQVVVSDPTVLRPMRDGNNLILSIDLPLQRHVEATLKKWIAESESRRAILHPSYPPITTGVLMIMDVRTGALLASVSLPAYDNNRMIGRISQSDYEELNDPLLTPMLNRAIGGHYPPGSTFKQISAAAALQFGLIGVDGTLHDPGFLQVESEFQPGVFYDTFRNSSPGDRGLINVVEALKNSSNVFFYQVIGGTNYVRNLREGDPYLEQGVGVDRLSQASIEWFGLGSPTGIDLPGEIGGFIPTRAWKEQEKHETWSVGNTYNMAIGQGDVLMTPLQLLSVTSAIANGGTRYKPHVLQAFSSPDGSERQEIAPEVLGTLPIEQHYLSAIREGMRQSTHEPTAYNVRIALPDQLALYQAIKLAGKTGTAEYVEYRDGQAIMRSHSWFVGFAPYDDPKYAAVVFLEGTGDLADGSGTLALPSVAEALAPLFGMPYTGQPEQAGQ